MAQYYVAYTKSLRYKYKANIRSNVTVFLLLNAFCCFVLPLILSYTSRGFWIKQFSFREQPTIKFKYRYLIVLEHRADEFFQDSLICATDQELIDSLDSNSDHCSFFEVIEPDDNKDGKADSLRMTIEITNVTDLDIVALHVFLIFDYRIHEECVFSSEMMTVSSHSFSKPIGRIDIMSGIITNMKKALDCRTRNDIKQNTLVFSELPSNLNTESYFTRILSSYISRTTSISLANAHSITTTKTKTAVNEPFVITIDIRYDEQIIIYKTRFWQLMKWAWIQYSSLLALFFFASKKIKKFVFQNRVLRTIKTNPRDDE